MTVYRAVLFDMDGVVIDTRAAVTDFWSLQATRNGVTLTETDFDRDIYGCLPSHTLDRLFPALGIEERRTVLEQMNASESVQTYRAIPGVLRLLSALHRAGIPTALVTSGTRNKIGAVSQQLGLDGLFTVNVGAEAIKRGKPAPDGYLQAARRLNILPSECVVFEDAVSGVQAAVAAGARCIGVQKPGQAAALITAGATDVVPDFENVKLMERNGQESQRLVDMEIGPDALFIPFLGDNQRQDKSAT